MSWRTRIPAVSTTSPQRDCGVESISPVRTARRHSTKGLTLECTPGPILIRVEDSMSECCCAGPTSRTEDAFVCPVSGTRSGAVELPTVKALLTERALARVATSSHRFCPEPSCDVVYFDAAGACYRTTDIRVPVWQKEPFGQRMVCYCFGECEDQIRAEITTTGF